jgi:hypothetical protein
MSVFNQRGDAEISRESLLLCLMCALLSQMREFLGQGPPDPPNSSETSWLGAPASRPANARLSNRTFTER